MIADWILIGCFILVAWASWGILLIIGAMIDTWRHRTDDRSGR